MRSANAFEAQFLPVIESSAGKRVVLDLAGTRYMSSVGLRVIMKAAQAGRQLDVTLALAGPNEDMREIIQISRFDKIFPVHDSVAAALAAE